MSSKLAFNNVVTVNPSATITTAQFANGTGEYTETGNDVRVSTGDFKRRGVRKAIKRSAQFQCYGNMVKTLRSAGGLGGLVTLKLGADTIASFTGIVTPVYDEDSMITRVKIDGDASIV